MDDDSWKMSPYSLEGNQLLHVDERGSFISVFFVLPYFPGNPDFWVMVAITARHPCFVGEEGRCIIDGDDNHVQGDEDYTIFAWR